MAELATHEVGFLHLSAQFLLQRLIRFPLLAHGLIGNRRGYRRMKLLIQEKGLAIMAGQAIGSVNGQGTEGLNKGIELTIEQKGREVIVQRGVVAGLFVAQTMEEIDGTLTGLRATT